MRIFSALSATLLVVVFGAMLVLPALAQNSRDATIARCLQIAKTQYPSDTNDQMGPRTAVYKACMTQAGQRP
jgi:hypothetical protein